jgi:hypothetical protein
MIINKKEHFNSAISNVIIFGNILTGIVEIVK